MQAKLVQWAIGIVLGMVKPEMIVKGVDMALDFVDGLIRKSKTTVDDALLLPAIGVIREALGIGGGRGQFPAIAGAVEQSAFMEWVVDSLLTILRPELVLRAGDMVLDFIENAVARTETTVDDNLVLPAINTIREALHIPDNDEKTEGGTFGAPVPTN